jgi:hypothetical protein
MWNWILGWWPLCWKYKLALWEKEYALLAKARIDDNCHRHAEQERHRSEMAWAKRKVDFEIQTWADQEKRHRIEMGQLEKEHQDAMAMARKDIACLQSNLDDATTALSGQELRHKAEIESFRRDAKLHVLLQELQQ